MKKQHIVIGVIIIVLLAGGTFLLTKINQSSKQTTTSSNAQSFPSDPNKLEVKGELVAGFPDFPVYSKATVVNSSRVKELSDPAKGYQAAWKVHDASVAKVMQWYLQELKNTGWQIVVPPNDPQGYGEQLATVSKGGSTAYLIVELEEEGVIAVIVDIPVINQ